MDKKQKKASIETQKMIGIDTESVLNYVSVTSLDNWKPSTTFCPKCGSTHTYVNSAIVLTSYPAQYQYKCIDCDNHWTEYTYMETLNKPAPNIKYNPPKFENTGWICPKCGSVYAPHVNKCNYCSQNQEFKPTWTVPLDPYFTTTVSTGTEANKTIATSTSTLSTDSDMPKSTLTVRCNLCNNIKEE